MSLVLTILTIVLGIGLAVLIHAVMMAPEGVESEAGFRRKPAAPVTGFLKAESLIKSRPTPVHGPSINAA